MGQTTISVFLKERERYLKKVQDAREQGSTYHEVSLVSSVDFELLNSLIAFHAFNGVETLHELRDEVLLKWLKEQVGLSFLCMDVEDLQALVEKSVHIRTQEPNPGLRITCLSADYKKFLRDRNIESLTEENRKVSTRHICALLRPFSLRSRIENHLRLHRADQKDWKSFFQYVKEKAIECDEFVSIAQKKEPQKYNKDEAKKTPFRKK